MLTQNRELGDSQQLKQPLLLSQVEQEQSCPAKLTDLSEANRGGEAGWLDFLDLF